MLARRCGVQETILYRLWPDKKAMFIAAIEWVYDLSTRTWEDLLAGGAAKKSAAERLLDYEATHHGEFGLYRIVFAGVWRLATLFFVVWIESLSGDWSGRL